jgi:putative oxidoreductase
MCLKKLSPVLRQITQALERYMWPVVRLLMRLRMAQIFWMAGQVKLADWDNTLSLFQDEYKVPFLPPEVAAYLATTFEVCCPILLTLGLFTRLATLPMLAMTAVIQFTYTQSPEHLFWALILGALLCTGAGPISLDAWIKKRYLQNG